MKQVMWWNRRVFIYGIQSKWNQVKSNQINNYDDDDDGDHNDGEKKYGKRKFKSSRNEMKCYHGKSFFSFLSVYWSKGTAAAATENHKFKAKWLSKQNRPASQQAND